jgi:hypothetical protein
VRITRIENSVLYSGSIFVDRWLENPQSLDAATLDKVNEIIDDWRTRLSCISWFMRGVNETIARMANDEDNCKGRFWEGRFKSQALLDEGALLSCMAYVDLNPVRAAMEPDLARSDFTSIQQRIFDYSKHKPNKSNSERQVASRVKQQRQLKVELGLSKQSEAPLMPFSGTNRLSIHVALPFTREDYFDLVDRTGRIIREGKRGFISSEIPPLISQLGINPDKWIEHVRFFGERYACSAGSGERLRVYANLLGRAWGKGVCLSESVYT